VSIDHNQFKIKHSHENGQSTKKKASHYFGEKKGQNLSIKKAKMRSK
jgi:hypothetical protein